MDKIKRYFETKIPVTTCNLRCHYCYITNTRGFANAIPKFQYSPEQVKQALTAERLGGISLFNLCADGETLLCDQIVDYIRVLLENGHYVMVVTNGTVSKRFDEICQLDRELLICHGRDERHGQQTLR